MFENIKKIFGDKKKLIYDINDESINNKVINLIDYRYKVADIYNNIVFVDVDIESCHIDKGHPIKLLNKIYNLLEVEFYPHKEEYRWRLTLVLEEE